MLETPYIPDLDDFLRAALREDIGSGDITTEAVVDTNAWAEMVWIAKSETVWCGGWVASRVFALIDGRVKTIEIAPEGGRALPGEALLKLHGPARALLIGERVALNIVARLCGVAAMTRAFTNAAAGTRAQIAATRKTMPLLRRLDKHAVRVGGGAPHRFGLDDGVLIKDNHVALAGGIGEAVKRARAHAHHLTRIEVEASTLDQVDEAIRAGADIVLLDNMDLDTLTRAVDLAAGRALLEASGNMTLERVREVAGAGVDYISAGALTHSVVSADISARMSAIPAPAEERP